MKFRINTELAVFSVMAVVCGLLLVLMLSYQGQGVWIDSHLKKVNTSGVKKIVIEQFRFVDGNWNKVNTMTALYDHESRLQKETRHTAEGELQFSYSYEYSENGNMVETEGKRRRKG